MRNGLIDIKMSESPQRVLRGARRRRTPPGAPPGIMVADPSALSPQLSYFAYGPDAIEEEQGATLAQIDDWRKSLPVLWIDVVGLGDISVLQNIGEKFGLHHLAMEDVVNVHQRPKVDDYDDHLFIVCRMPSANHLLETEQVSLFLGRDFVITFQEKPGDCFDPVRNRLRTSRGRIRTSAADYLAYALLDAVTDDYFPLLEAIGERIDELEESIMSDPVPDDVNRVHALKRDLLTTRRAVWPQRDTMNQLVRDDSPLISEPTKVYLRDCVDHTFQLIDLIETYRETVSDLTDIFLSAQSIRMNQIMKVLTVIATIFMPLTLITGIYGMNFDTKSSSWNMPELGWSFGYLAVMALMLAIGLGMLEYFRRRGWIGRPRRRAARRRRRHSV